MVALFVWRQAALRTAPRSRRLIVGCVVEKKLARGALVRMIEIGGLARRSDEEAEVCESQRRE